MSRLLTKPGLLTETTCDRLVEFFDANIDRLGESDLVPEFSGRVISYGRLDECIEGDLHVKRLFDAIRFIVGQDVCSFFRAKCVLPEKSQLVVWPQGSWQGLHRDETRATTTYASVIYLNDDYEGGETFFADDRHVRPEKGTMIAFHGKREEHGVRQVRSGRRYTMPVWFTDEPSAQER